MVSPEEEPPTVATLREGQEVAGVFACSRKERQLSRAGVPYLTVELRDRTGSILARAFRDAAVVQRACDHLDRLRCLLCAEPRPPGEILHRRGRVTSKVARGQFGERFVASQR